MHCRLHSLLAIQSCLKVCQDVGDGGADLLLEKLHVLPRLLALLVANPDHHDYAYACEDKIIGSNTVLKMVHIMIKVVFKGELFMLATAVLVRVDGFGFAS